MLAERGVNVDHPRFTAGFSVMRLKWKNGCAGTGVTLPIFCPWHMDETYVKVNGRWAYLCTGPSTAGAALSIFISPPVVTAKLHTGFWVKSSTT